MEDYKDFIIAESYTLPSLGKVYEGSVNPNIKIRSMTTEEEMKRLGHSDTPYKMLSEIIDDCLVEKPGIPTYDLCVGDYQFLLHKLRIVTYGKDYKIETRCPICGKLNEYTIDLESLNVVKYTEDFAKYFNITLPKSKKKVELRLQTPRMLDEINNRSKELLKKSPDMKGEPAFLFTLQSLIYKVDGEVLDDVKAEAFVRHLPMIDANYIIRSVDKINIGIDTKLSLQCKHCGIEYSQIFPITGEFFGPSID